MPKEINDYCSDQLPEKRDYNALRSIAMAENGVTLQLGEQMAIVFLGVNVLVPLTLSAVLASLILLIVQTNRFVKRIMGRANSKEINNNMDDIREAVKKPVKSLDTGSGQTEGHSAVRKRRSSIVQPLEASYHSSSSDVNKDKTLYQNSSSLTSQNSGENDEGPTRTRKHRIGSGNRVSPLTPPAETKDKQIHVSWAWKEQSFDEERKQPSNRKQNNRVLSPSQCHIQTSSPEVPMKKSLFPDDDMKAYDIW